MEIDLSLLGHGEFTQTGGQKSRSANFRKPPPDVSAIFAASDVMALGAMEAVRSVGREVPRDVAVVGYDDSEAASLARPPSHHRPAGRAADGGEDGCERNLERNE